MSYDGKCNKSDSEVISSRPFSTVWVSTLKKDVKLKRIQEDEEEGVKKSVTPSQAYDDLHSLLATVEGDPRSEASKAIKKLEVNLQKSHVLKEETAMSLCDSLIEENSGQILLSEATIKNSSNNDSGTINQSAERQLQDEGGGDGFPKWTKSVVSQCIIPQLKGPQNQIEVKTSSRDFPTMQDHETTETLSPTKTVLKNGKLISEVDLSSFVLTNNKGQNFPLNLKFVWEASVSDFVESGGHVLKVGPSMTHILKKAVLMAKESCNKTTEELISKLSEEGSITNELNNCLDNHNVTPNLMKPQAIRRCSANIERLAEPKTVHKEVTPKMKERVVTAQVTNNLKIKKPPTKPIINKVVKDNANSKNTDTNINTITENFLEPNTHPLVENKSQIPITCNFKTRRPGLLKNDQLKLKTKSQVAPNAEIGFKKRGAASGKNTASQVRMSGWR